MAGIQVRVCIQRLTIKYLNYRRRSCYKRVDHDFYQRGWERGWIKMDNKVCSRNAILLLENYVSFSSYSLAKIKSYKENSKQLELCYLNYVLRFLVHFRGFSFSDTLELRQHKLLFGPFLTTNCWKMGPKKHSPSEQGYPVRVIVGKETCKYALDDGWTALACGRKQSVQRGALKTWA